MRLGRGRRFCHPFWGVSLVLVGCSGFGVGAEDHFSDGGTRYHDGDASMGGAATDAGTSPVPGGGAEGDPADDAAERIAACYDLSDNDTDGLVDCEDPSCQQTVRSCCVGRVSPSCCVPGAVWSAPFASCGGSIESCTEALEAGLSTFGDGAVTVAVRGVDRAPSVALEGTETDSGLALPIAPHPTTTPLTLSTEIALPREAPVGIEALGIAFVAEEQALSAGSRVRPIAGLLVNRARDEVSLVLSDERVDAWPLPDADVYESYRVRVDGSGVTFEMGPEGAPAFSSTLPFDWRGALRPVLYGRLSEPGASPTRMRARRLELQTQRCDAPSPVERAEEPALGADAAPEGWDRSSSVAAPSVIAYEGMLRMAVSIDESIHLATGDATAFTVVGDLNAPVITAAAGTARSDGVGHPALFATPTGELELWFVGYADGVGSIMRAEGGTDGFSNQSVEVLLSPAGEVTSFDAPAPFIVGEEVHVAVRETRADGPGLIAHYRILDATGALDFARIQTLVVPDDTRLDAFDRDEVTSPAVTYERGVYRVAYSGRRGTRWSIGLTVSDDLTTWRPIGVVLQGDGRGFDALGVRDPSPVTVGEETLLYYTGTDLTSTQIGTARGPSAPVD